MDAHPRAVLALLLLLATAGAAPAATIRGFDLAVFAGGMQRPEYLHRGVTFIEALRGQEYTLRVHNPLGCRVAVALAVDGLNTVDGRHTSARRAAMWVIEPFDTIEITGWQVSGWEARRFYFTSEADSYGAWLGRTENLGVIEAAFFKERTRPTPITRWIPWLHKDQRPPRGVSGSAENETSREKSAGRLSDEAAATGIGARVENPVEAVHLDLEHSPAATVRIRYEFRPELVRMGILPPSFPITPWQRREHARGFEFCPDPDTR